MTNHRLVIGTIAALGIAVYALGSNRTTQVAPRDVDAAQLGARIAELEKAQQRTELRHAVGWDRAATQPAVGVEHTDERSAPPRATTAPDGPQLVQEQIDADRAHFDELDRALADEPVDAAWAAETTRALASSFQAAKLDTLGRLASVECKTSRCEIAFEHARDREHASTPQSTQRLVEWLLQQPCSFHVEGDALADEAQPNVQHIHLDCQSRRPVG